MKQLLSLVALISILVPHILLAAEGGLTLSPQSGSYAVGENFQVSLYANPDNVNGKAAEADIRFNTSVLEVAALSTAGSALTLWSVEPTYSNEEGVIRFAGWSNQPFAGPALLLTVTFRAKTSGTHDVRIESGALLQNDGRATNILTRLGNASYTFDPIASAVETNGGAVLGASTETEEAIPDAPTVDQEPEGMLSGDKLVISGLGPKEGRVNVWLEKAGESATRESVDVKRDGSFVYISDERLSAGTYRVWLEGYSKFGVLSPQTTPLAFTVLPDGGSLAASALLGVLSTPAFLGALILVFGFLLGYLGYRVMVRR